MRTYRGFLLACLAGLAAAALAWTLSGRPRISQPPPFTGGPAGSVTITLEGTEGGRPAAPVTSTDPGKIEALAAVLRRGEPTSDHKCGDAGVITFRPGDGSQAALGILAGHDPRYYEYRLYSPDGYDNFRVDRAAFLRALAGLGVTGIALRD